jgi:hypothetical protein
MKKNTLNVLAKISLVIFSFLLLYYGFAGGTSAVWDGDSIAYHIPIAKLILSGKIFNPAGQTYSVEVDRGMVFSPGASEIILSLFILARIPLNLLDVAGILIFFLCYEKTCANLRHTRQSFDNFCSKYGNATFGNALGFIPNNRCLACLIFRPFAYFAANTQKNLQILPFSRICLGNAFRK